MNSELIKSCQSWRWLEIQIEISSNPSEFINSDGTSQRSWRCWWVPWVHKVSVVGRNRCSTSGCNCSKFINVDSIQRCTDERISFCLWRSLTHTTYSIVACTNSNRTASEIRTFSCRVASSNITWVCIARHVIEWNYAKQATGNHWKNQIPFKVGYLVLINSAMHKAFSREKVYCN